MNRVDTFLELTVKQGGSDLHMLAGESPRIRIHGSLHRVRFRELSVQEVEAMLREIMAPRQWQHYTEEHHLDFSYQSQQLGRFRLSAHRHLQGPGFVARSISEDVAALDKLGLPDSVQKLASVPNGLTLVTGPTGSGKSTTLAAIIDHINTTRKGHIITLEDPIEFVHQFKNCSVTQREIGVHTPSFAEGLRNSLREDPDVILVGEMRDLETVSLALTAAETGIQVLGTLHTSGAVRSIDRVINVFPANRQPQVRTMLSESLNLVVSQQLVPNRAGDGRLLVAEVLVGNHAVGSMIRSGKVHQLSSIIQAGGKEGMQAFDDQLTRRLRAAEISPESAYAFAFDKSRFASFVSRETAA